jgi:hypothetical protein
VRYEATGSRSSNVAAGDLNHEGLDDIVIVNGDTTNSLDVLLSNGDGTFTQSKYTLFPDPLPNGNGPSSQSVDVVIADLDGDGLPDVATANRAANSIALLRNNGDGTFGPANGDGTYGTHYDYYPPNGAAVVTAPISLAVGDFNGDRWPDLLAATSLSDTATVLLNQRDGTYDDIMSYDLGQFTSAVAAGDVTGDVAVDAIVATDQAVTVFPNNGDFTPVPGITPVFGNLSAPTVTYGTAASTFSGTDLGRRATLCVRWRHHREPRHVYGRRRRSGNQGALRERRAGHESAERRILCQHRHGPRVGRRRDANRRAFREPGRHGGRRGRHAPDHPLFAGCRRHADGRHLPRRRHRRVDAQRRQRHPHPRDRRPRDALRRRDVYEPVEPGDQ